MEPPARGRPLRIYFFWAALAAVVLLPVAWMALRDVDFDAVKMALRDWMEFAGTLHPAVFTLAIALLPYAAVPVSAIYLTAGAVLDPGPALFWCGLGLALNIALGHLVGARWLRGPVARFLERRGHRLPAAPPGEHATVVAFVRLIPGPPLAIQNLLLAMAGVPFGVYLAVSWPLQFLFTLAFVLTGHGVVGGGFRYFLTGAGAIIALALLARFVKHWRDSRRRAAASPAHESPPAHRGA